MSGIITTLTVFFIIVCIFLVMMVLLQSDKNSGMGILGGSSQSAFGSSTADVVTKITAVLVALFLLGSLALSSLQSFAEKSRQIDTSSVTTENTGKTQQ